MRYLITVSYDGTEFSGYQKQPKMRTVQGEIEKTLKEISGGKKIDIHASGRTDAGVCRRRFAQFEKCTRVYREVYRKTGAFERLVVRAS